MQDDENVNGVNFGDQDKLQEDLQGKEELQRSSGAVGNKEAAKNSSGTTSRACSPRRSARIPPASLSSPAGYLTVSDLLSILSKSQLKSQLNPVFSPDDIRPTHVSGKLLLCSSASTTSFDR